MAQKKKTPKGKYYVRCEVPAGRKEFILPYKTLSGALGGAEDVVMGGHTFATRCCAYAGSPARQVRCWNAPRGRR